MQYFFYPVDEKQFKQEAKGHFVRTMVFDTSKYKISNSFIRKVDKVWMQTCKNNIATDKRIKTLSGNHFQIYSWVVQSESDFGLPCFK